MIPAARSVADISLADPRVPLPTGGSIAVSPDARRDVLACALLLALTAIMVLPGSLTLPMALWDESRNANNAIEMTITGGWMVPTFDGSPDHWNTKPPLLIWIMALLLRSDIDPMLAVRLPSIFATMGSVLLVYLACRMIIRDRLAGVLGGLLVLSSVLFMGDHVGRTGDYDALLSFLVLGFVLCAGHYIDHPEDRPGVWIGASGVFLFLAIMTKGVAAGMAVPGLLAYAVGRRRIGGITRDWRAWVTVFGVVAGASLFLVIRESLDPGYLASVWYNDVSGRLLIALDDHAEGPGFYLFVLAMTFQPAVPLSPTLLFVLGKHDPTRRNLCLLVVLTAASWVMVLSGASTKINWYIAPAVPLLAIAIAASTAGCLRRMRWSRGRLVVLAPMCIALAVAFWDLNVRAEDSGSAYEADQAWYGPFLREIRGQTGPHGALIVDLGLPNDSGFQHYNPIARFFALDARRRGEEIEVAPPGVQIAGGTNIISCDPRVRDWLTSRSAFTVLQRNTRCVLGHTADQPLTPAE